MKATFEKQLQWIDKTLRGLVCLAYRIPRTVFSVTLAVCLIALIPGLKPTSLSRVEDLLEGGSLQRIILERRESLFPSTPTAFMHFTRRDGSALSRGEVCAIHQWTTHSILPVKGIKSLETPFQIARPELHEGRLLYLKMLPNPCSSDSNGINFRTREAFDFSALKKTPFANLFSNGSDLNLTLTLHPGQSSGALEDLQSTLEARIAHFLASEPALNIGLFGSHAFQVALERGYAHDHSLNLGLLALLLLSLRLVLGTWRSGILVCLALFLTKELLFSIMALAKIPIDALSSGMLLVLAVSTLQDFLFISQEQLRGTPPKQVFERLVTPAFFTSLTTAIGFGTLCLSDLAPLRRFGLFAALGAMTEWVVAFVTFPALVALWPACGRWVRPEKAVLLGSLQKLANLRLPRKILPLLTVLGLCAASGVFFLKVEDSPFDVLPSRHAFRTSLESFKQSHGFESSAQVLFSAGVPQSTEHTALQAISHEECVAQTSSASQHINFLTAHLHPIHQELVMRDVNAAGLLNAMVAPSGETLANLYLKNTSISCIMGVEKSVAKACPKGECALTGEFVALATLTSQIIGALSESFLVSLALVFAILTWLCLAMNQKRALGAILCSAAWGPALMFGIVAALGIPMTFVTSIFAASLVGLAGDNAIQYLFAAQESQNLNDGLNDRALGSVQIGILTASLPLVSLLSAFAPARTLGLLFGAGVLILLFGDLWILRGWLDWRQGKAGLPATTHKMK